MSNKQRYHKRLPSQRSALQFRHWIGDNITDAITFIIDLIAGDKGGERRERKGEHYLQNEGKQ